jgi:hypothetical protein
MVTMQTYGLGGELLAFSVHSSDYALSVNNVAAEGNICVPVF